MSGRFGSGGTRRLDGEQGFTLVEVMVALLLVATALMALGGSFDVAGKSAIGAQRHEQAVSVAQRHLEEIRSLRWSRIALSSAPTQQSAGNPPNDPTPANPRNPDYYVNGQALRIKTSYRNMNSADLPGAPAAGEPFVLGGNVAPRETFTSGSTRGTVHNYVTWQRECVAATGQCDSEAAKRITVAVVLDRAGNGAGPSKPVWVSTIVADPNAAPPGTPPPDDDGDTKPAGQPFFLYDTPCSQSTWSSTVASHVTPDTAREGARCNVTPTPDLMSSIAAPYGIDPLPFENYSADVARTSPAHGLVLEKAASGCPISYPAASAATAKRQVHAWASTPFASAFKSPADDPATAGHDSRTGFSFWTQTVDGAQAGATLCFSLRRVKADGTVAPLFESPAAELTHQYTQAAWPWEEPTKLSFSLVHRQYTLYPGERLLLTLSLRHDSATNVALFYDHPTQESFLTTLTTTPTVALD